MLSRSSRKVKTTGLNHFCIIPTKCLVTIPNLLSARCFLRAVSEIKVQPDTVGMTLTPVNICKRRSLRSHSTQLLNPKCHSNIKFSSPTVTYHAHSVATIRHKQLAKAVASNYCQSNSCSTRFCPLRTANAASSNKRFHGVSSLL